MSEVGVEIVKTEEVKESGIKYLNINVSNSEVERNPDIVRLCADAGIVEYVKPSGDAISRQSTLKPYEGLKDDDVIAVWLIRKNIEQQPSVNPQEPKYCDRNICVSNEYNGIGCDECEVTKSQEPKTGHWEWVQYDYHPRLGDWICSECKSVAVVCVRKEEEGGIPLYKYCPQCGARMVEPQESEG